jgi:2,5-diketo-D-gluconate reductase A
LGFGTFGFSDPSIIVSAIENGFRLLDTASYYKNEDTVGKAV